MSRPRLFRITMGVMTAVMAAAMLAIPAVAMPLPPDSGDLYIHKYIGAPTGNTANGTEQVIPTSAIPVNGVVFDLYKVTTPSTDLPPVDVPSAGMRYVLDSTAPAAPVMKVYDGNVLIETFDVTPVGSVTTAGLGVALASDLDQGFYLVIEDTAASTGITNALNQDPMFISSAAMPFLVAVPMTNPDGDGWLTDVHVYPKNEALAIDKEVDLENSNPSVMVGDTVSYKITVTVPAGIATSKKYDIIDILDAALDFEAGSVVVTAMPSGTVMAAGAGNDYVVSYNSTTRTLLVSFTDDGRGNLEGETSVVITFDAVVNASILSRIDYTVPNQATVEFTNEGDMDFEADSGGEGSDIHTAAIEVTKLNQAGAALNGAKFKIASSQANAAAGRFMRIDPDTKVIYDYGTAGWNSLAGHDYEVTVSNVATFTGLRDMDDDEAYLSYYLVETQAPSGYNLLSQAIEVTFTGGESNYTYELEVLNSRGFTLPQTGGIGTLVFTVSGIVLIGLAIVIGLRTKTRSARLSK